MAQSGIALGLNRDLNLMIRVCWLRNEANRLWRHSFTTEPRQTGGLTEFGA
jgi:hypothetical protein